MVARGSDLPGVTTAHMMERLIDGYEPAFGAVQSGAARCETTNTGNDIPPTVKRLMREAARRNWKHLAYERTEGVEPVIPIGKRFWPLSPNEYSAVETLFTEENLRRLATSLRLREDDAPVRVMDAAYWRKGCCSLGRLRVTVLIAIGKGKNERHCLMDVKQAIAAAAPHSATATMPDDNAKRVLTGARKLSPFLGDRMLAAGLMGKSVFIRELLPQDFKVEIERLSRDEALGVAEFLAHAVGRGHARQMDSSGRKQWRVELRRNRSKSLNAPSWLWNSVVDLAAPHEAAFLQHCRRYALEAAV